nr:unnamed protein product [Naegleria fowleri]
MIKEIKVAGIVKRGQQPIIQDNHDDANGKGSSSSIVVVLNHHHDPPKTTKEFQPYPLNVPASSPLTDMEYKCQILSQLKEDIQTLNKNDLSLEHHFEMFDHLRELLHRISNRIFMKPAKNEMYLCGGLKTLCLLFNQLAVYMFRGTKNEHNSKMWKLFEEILSECSFILYKMAEHAKARKVMLLSGILYSIWGVIQQLCAISAAENNAENALLSENKKFYKLKMNYNAAVESSIVHMDDVMELLSSGMSLSADFAELLKSANRSLFGDSNETEVSQRAEEVDNFGLQCCDVFIGTFDLPLETWTQETFNEFVRTNTNPQYFIRMNDFDINLHGIILQTRTKDFLEKFFVKWNFENSHGDSNADQKSNQVFGFYILKKDQNISRFSLLKFIQVVYTDSLVISSKDIDILRKEFDAATKEEHKKEDDSTIRIFSVDSMLKEQGLLLLLDSLKNESTKEAILHSLNMGYSNHHAERNQDEESLFDEFDEQLVKQEWEIISKTRRDRHEEELLFSRKDAIKRNAIQTGGLEQDMTELFISITEEDESSASDVVIQTECNELGAIDLEILSSDAYHTKYLKFVKKVLLPTRQRGGVFAHRCILAARSEYMRKVFKYECTPKCLSIVEGVESNIENVIDCSVKTIEIPNFSYSTLFLVLQFIYCGQNVLKTLANVSLTTSTDDVSDIYRKKLTNQPLIPETFIECLIASDLFLLYGLKKFAEQQIIQQLNETSNQPQDKEFLVNLYNISQLYNSDPLKEKCEQLLN